MVHVTSNSNYCIPEVKKLVANNKVPFELEALTIYLTTQQNPRLKFPYRLHLKKEITTLLNKKLNFSLTLASPDLCCKPERKRINLCVTSKDKFPVIKH